MTRYVALFGQLTAGGTRLTLADLRYALEREEFDDVETVVSGSNVLFSYDDRPTEGLEDLMRHMMVERFDMESFVAVRNTGEIRAGIEGNPFRNDDADGSVHTQFLAGRPEPAQFARLVADFSGRGPERLAIAQRALFIDYQGDPVASRLTGPFIARRLGCEGASRDVRTLARILEKMI
jgi:uncharacterized protein (DUF1697 family)